MRVSTVVRAAFVAVTATTAAASGADIVSALDNVDSATQKLQNIVNGWSGGLLGSLPILPQSARVLSAINDGTDTANDSDPLTQDEALGIATAVTTLSTTVNSTMTALINRHDDFEHLLLAPVVLIDLKLQKKASDDMSAAIIAKVPAALQGIASNLAAPIGASFDQAIEAFSLSNGI
ncbi:antigenic cell wall galactomannoprotein [Sporothrix schenckii 1099-18]|uniref:Antigenic cell wall galactomannoprotein n=2 Tax=Sporothrix schenckii TaxID=29908 RepID=U7Q1C5_SPOS1|nr:antigenic cell wall galactomannoprotein [Sporothrix schenckii 1099-18]ERT01709.1 hypothetical protein HMPREF1624_00003 [Sporothrix schenckii ATCC 58251]KJR81173.1 antigenic cell wall galactomannoprotein [Sporothrix schenckii 1099-18]